MKKTETETKTRENVYCDSCGKKLFTYEEDGYTPDLHLWGVHGGEEPEDNDCEATVEVCADCYRLLRDEFNSEIFTYRKALEKAIAHKNLEIYNRIVEERMRNHGV